MTGHNIILWDIETLPDLKPVMARLTRLYDGCTLKANMSTMICFGYKRLGDKKAKCINAWDFPKRWAKDVNDDYEVIKAAGKILQEATGMVTHYGTGFDLKFLNTRLLFHGLPPIPRMKHLDTCKTARANIFLYSNRLNEVAKFFGLDEKMVNGGWGLWVDVLARKKSALKVMTRYCKQDVEVLEQVYEKLKPMSRHIPNFNLLIDDEGKCCPNCGKQNYKKHGLYKTVTQVYQRYMCKTCFTTFRTDKKDRMPRVL